MTIKLEACKLVTKLVSRLPLVNHNTDFRWLNLIQYKQIMGILSHKFMTFNKSCCPARLQNSMMQSTVSRYQPLRFASLQIFADSSHTPARNSKLNFRAICLSAGVAKTMVPNLFQKRPKFCKTLFR